MPVLELVLQLTSITSDALEAARELRSEDLRRHDEQRADLVFHLQLELQQSSAISDEERSLLKSALADLKRLEERLTRISRLVTTALRPLNGPPTPTLYAHTGSLRG